MNLSVLIPTVGNREEFLAETKAAFEETVPGCEVLVIYGCSWGEGCNRLYPEAKGDYLLLACDDTKPHPGWFDAARTMVDAGLTPASRYFHPDGTPLRDDFDLLPHMALAGWTRSFLLTPVIYEEIGPLIDTTWYADFDYSDRLTASGRTIHACNGYSFTHLPTQRDWLTVEEDTRQRLIYETHAR